MRLLLITVISLCGTLALSQDIKPKAEIEYEGQFPIDSKIQKIEFKDATGNVLKEFDPKTNNPFKRIRSQGQVISQANGKAKVKLQGRRVQDLIPNISKFKNEEAGNRSVSFVETPFNTIKDGNKNFVGVTYKLRLLDEYYQEIGSTAKIQIYNGNGNIRRTIDTETDVSIAVTTNDGSYLGFNYGGVVDHNWNKVFDEGFSIYDLNTGEKILDLKAESGYSIGVPAIRENLIVFSLHSSNYKYYVIDPENRKYYVKAYTKDQLFKLKAITTDGFLFQSSGNEKFDSYTGAFAEYTF